MKAVRFAAYGGPEVLQVVDVDQPHASAGTIRIAVRAVGINAVDWKIRAGYLREAIELSMPSGTGIDAAGLVDEIGDGVTHVQVGTPVFGCGPDTLAEYAVLDAWEIVPDGMSFAEAAALPTPVETAIRILDQVGVVKGQTLLICGASGGVGSAVAQLAAHRGITVIGTASGANQSYLRQLGVAATTYGEGFAERVRQLAPKGVDAALDLWGSGVIADCIKLVGTAAKVLSIADTSAPDSGARFSGQQGDRTAAVREAARLHSSGVLRVPVARVFGLGEAALAHEASATGHLPGRVVVTLTGRGP